MIKKFFISIFCGIIFLISGCSEEKPEIKTVDYWLSHKQEMRDYWMIICKKDVNNTDENCNVLKSLSYGAERAAREKYDAIIRLRSK